MVLAAWQPGSGAAMITCPAARVRDRSRRSAAALNFAGEFGPSPDFAVSFLGCLGLSPAPPLSTGFVACLTDALALALSAPLALSPLGAAGDLVLRRLDDVLVDNEEDALDTLDLVRRLTDLAMATDRALDRVFWLRALADTITVEPSEEHDTLFIIAVRRIHSTHRVPKTLRNIATRRLAAMVRPIR